MLKSFLFAGAAAIALAPSLAYADDAETVIVTATRIATPQDQVGSSVSVVDAAQIETQQLKSLPDVLQDVPGLQVVRTGGQGGQTSVFTRGTNSNHTKIIVDGIDVSDPSTPNDTFDLGKLSAADIAQVEVLRGPGSGLYGSDAIGGVINVITKAGDGPLSLTAHAEGGSFDTFNQDATISGSDDRFHYRVTVAHSHAGNTPATPASILLAGEKANGDYYDSVTASTKLGYNITDYFDIGLVAHTNNSLGKITGDGFSLVTFTGFPAFTQTRLAVVDNDARLTAHLVLGSFDQTLGFAVTTAVTSSNDPNNGKTHSSGTRTKLDWQGNWSVIEGETVVLGAETARDTIHLPLSAGITINAGYAELQSAWGALSNSASIRLDDNSRYGSVVTGRIAPSYRIAETGTRLKASFGNGFKSPPLESLFGPFAHNPNLKPESSVGYDAGFDQELGSQLSGGATWYHNDIKNLILSGPGPTFMPINIDKARTQGVETYLAWTPIDVLKLRADYTYGEARDTTTNKRLLRRPTNKLSGDARWQVLPQLSVDAAVRYVAGAVDVGRESFIQPIKDQNYVTADLSAGYVISDMFTLYGRVDNLFDESYQNPNGFLQPGRGLYAGIKATF